MREDYSRARKLASFEYLGHRFDVVRRRFEGKHWRNYLMVLHDGVPITDDFRWEATEPHACVSEVMALLTKLFRSEPVLREGLVSIHEKADRERAA